MRRELVPLLGATACLVGLAGCAMQAQRVGEDLAWILQAAPGEDAVLMLGVPNSDYIRVTMECKPGSGAVDVTLLASRRDEAVVELHTGKTWNRYRGAGHADEELGDYVIDLQKLSAVDPVLQSFADTGELTIKFRDRVVVLPNAFAQAHDFMAVCRAS